MCLICQMTQTFDPLRHDEGKAIFADIYETGDAPGIETLPTDSGVPTMDVGDSFFGTIGTAGDTDWIAVDLVAGTTYQIDMLGADSGVGTLVDPYLWLFGIDNPNAGPIVLDQSDDDGNGYESQIIYTAINSGTFYILADEWGETGTYRIDVSETVGGGPTLPAIGDAVALGIGAEIPAEISASSEVDLYAVSLVAGEDYQFDLRAIDSSLGTLDDPLLTLYSWNGSDYVEIASDDDGGNGWESRLFVNATETGTFYLAASEAANNTGTYVIEAANVSGFDDPTDTPGVDDFPTSVTIPSITVGETYSGTINNFDDSDWIAIDLEAGTTYFFDMRGFDSGSGTLGDPFLWLYDLETTETGFSISSVASDDNGGLGLESRFAFTATDTETYYILADVTQGTGTYEIEVQEFLPPEPQDDGDLDELALQLTDGYWGDQQYTWDTSTSNQITVDITDLTAEGQQLARWAMQAWEMVANLDFVEVTSGGMIVWDDDEPGAFAYTPGGSPTEANVSTQWLIDGGTTLDSYSFQTYIHEFGHALGLGHQGNYNGSAEYGFDNLFGNDSWQMSVMSYFSQTENTRIDASYAFTSGPMMADIVAIQNLYGAPDATSATSGDTTYGSGSNLGNYLDEIFASVTTGQPSANIAGNNLMAFTVYDRDGTDTLNFAGLQNDIRLDLRETEFSDFGSFTGILGIARGTDIENGNTGAGNDSVTGNDLDNVIETNGGDDEIIGGGGDDTVNGGTGSDILILDGSWDEFQFSYEAGLVVEDLQTETGENTGTDTLIDMEMIAFSDGSTAALDVRTTRLDIDFAQDGIRFLSLATDSNDSRGWARIEQSYAEDGITLAGKTIFYDDGSTLETEYDASGVRIREIRADLPDAKSWDTYVKTYWADGTTNKSIVVTYDDGREFTTSFTEGGLRTSQIWNDALDTQSWQTITRHFAEDGATLTGQTIVYDDGRQMVRDYDANGRRTQQTESDLLDAKNWTTKQTQYGPDGTSLTQQTILYDDGRQLQTEFDSNGTRTKQTFSDPLDAQSWTTIEREYNPDTSKLSKLTYTLDNGRQTVTNYSETGVRTGVIQTDPLDSQTWDSIELSFAGDGRTLTDRVMTYDNGLVRDSDFNPSGREIFRITTDTLDAYEWEYWTRSFDDNGTVLETVYVYDAPLG